MRGQLKKIRGILLGIFLLYLCIHYWKNVSALLLEGIKASKPLLLGAMIAYIINILMSCYEKKLLGRIAFLKKHKLDRAISVLLAFATVLIILALVLYLILPTIYSCIVTLANKVPGILSGLEVDAWLHKHFPNSLDFNIQEKILSAFQNVAGKLTDFMGRAVNWISSIASAIVTLFMGLIFSMYLLFGKEKLSGQMVYLGHTYLQEKTMEKLLYILRTLNKSFHNFIVGQVTEAFILGSLCAVGMLIFRFPYALMLGTFLGATALIPIAGAYIGAIVGTLMILSESPTKAVGFLIFIIILQQIEGNVIYPKVVGSSIGLPGIWVFTSIVIGGSVFGFLGMFLGVPLAAAAYQMLKDDTRRRNRQVAKNEKAEKA